MPPHFYGQMAKTDSGCQILADKGHFTDFVQFIRHHDLDSDDADLIMKLKSILWAVVSSFTLPMPRLCSECLSVKGKYWCNRRRATLLGGE